ncbi:hypothetical protein ACJ72_01601 [Emergomyces africanus]|uniref:Uncharacterized protein n=1 Tax=Emergomyces africanus TaxID=1955775 RepID=A0A1B7P4S4_9EURO|nr:hypothetical protein ACJ72_01601 [Emergomyces africanus]
MALASLFCRPSQLSSAIRRDILLPKNISFETNINAKEAQESVPRRPASSKQPHWLSWPSFSLPSLLALAHLLNMGEEFSLDPEFCSGFGGIQCPPPKQCYDEPRDECDPDLGHRDCPGICH